MKRYKLYILFLNLILLLIYFNHSVVSKEELLENGKLVLLELAPVDPRSLMQGDYMALRYAIATEGLPDVIPKRGYCVAQLDQQGVVNKVRFQKDPVPLSEGEYLIRYSAPKLWDVHIGAESYFFQEGHAERYDSAKYGGIKIDGNGNSLLIGLYDKDLRKIE